MTGNFRLTASLLTLIVASASLVACGGGGSSPSASSPTTPRTLNFFSSLSQHETIDDNEEMAAQRFAVAPPSPEDPASPSAPSDSAVVTQSSQSNDTADAAVTFSDNTRNYTLNVEGTEFLSSTADEVQRGTIPGVSSFVEVAVLYSNDELSSAILATDRANSEDNEYIVWGIWGSIPADTMDVSDFTYGAFAHGTTPYNVGTNADTLTALAGDAMYEGHAFGLQLSNNQSEVFLGEVTLNADFDASGQGTMSGRVHNITFETTEYDPDSAIILGMADIDPDGSFEGPTSISVPSGRLGDTTLGGMWGGRFFGSETGTDYPGSAAGTLGLSDASGSNSLMGAFKTDRNP
ncbi:MAG: hypothetical protein V6Z81_07645 [Parvularculales bacterium]